MEGAAARCRQMLEQGERPPLMFYLVWTDYTRLSKEIAAAALGRAIDRPAGSAGSDSLGPILARLQQAGDPDELRDNENH